MPKKKKKREEEHENLERWLVSYADFITLLFAFFVTMYAISRVDEQKLGSAVESLQRALGSLIQTPSSRGETGILTAGKTPFDVTIMDTPQMSNPEREYFEKMAGVIQKEVDKISKEVSKENPPPVDQIKYIIDKRGLVIRVPENFFFHSGEAAIRPEFLPILDVLARSLEKISNHIRIEGHTDSVPINTLKFPSNWELSTARATNIVRYLLASYNFIPSRISATGYAEFRAIAPNTTPEGRLQNRRVDVVVLSTKEGEAEPGEKKGLNPPSPPYPTVAPTGK